MSRKLSNLRRLPEHVGFNNIGNSEDEIEQRIGIERCKSIIDRDSGGNISDTELQKVVDQFYVLGEVAISLFLRGIAGGHSPSGKE